VGVVATVAVGVRVGESVQARAAPEAGPSTLAIAVLMVVMRLGRFWVAMAGRAGAGPGAVVDGCRCRVRGQ
jgi:hypothetical protein